MEPYGAHVLHRDGIEATLVICPPTPRRGIMLIDASWEVKEEYAAIPKAIARIRARWNVGIVALWYPILADAPHAPMLDELSDLDPDALRHEVSFGPAREGHRMIGSGLFVTNPPYGLAREAERIGTIFDALPALR
jgi:23S rRNA (adenine2030-N6)-methyltransferase